MSQGHSPGSLGWTQHPRLVSVCPGPPSVLPAALPVSTQHSSHQPPRSCAPNTCVPKTKPFAAQGGICPGRHQPLWYHPRGDTCEVMAQCCGLQAAQLHQAHCPGTSQPSALHSAISTCMDFLKTATGPQQRIPIDRGQPCATVGVSTEVWVCNLWGHSSGGCSRGSPSSANMKLMCLSSAAGSTKTPAWSHPSPHWSFCVGSQRTSGHSSSSESSQPSRAGQVGRRYLGKMSVKSSREGTLSRAFSSPLAGDICSQDQFLHPCGHVTKHLLETTAVKSHQASTLQPLQGWWHTDQKFSQQDAFLGWFQDPTDTDRLCRAE